MSRVSFTACACCGIAATRAIAREGPKMERVPGVTGRTGRPPDHRHLQIRSKDRRGTPGLGFIESLIQVRSGSACLNSNPRFISDLRAGCQKCGDVHDGSQRLRRTDRGGQLGAHRGLHPTRPASVSTSGRSAFLCKLIQLAQKNPMPPLPLNTPPAHSKTTPGCGKTGRSNRPSTG